MSNLQSFSHLLSNIDFFFFLFSFRYHTDFLMTWGCLKPLKYQWGNLWTTFMPWSVDTERSLVSKNSWHLMMLPSSLGDFVLKPFFLHYKAIFFSSSTSWPSGWQGWGWCWTTACHLFYFVFHLLHCFLIHGKICTSQKLYKTILNKDCFLIMQVYPSAPAGGSGNI